MFAQSQLRYNKDTRKLSPQVSKYLFSDNVAVWIYVDSLYVLMAKTNLIKQLKEFWKFLKAIKYLK